MQRKPSIELQSLLVTNIRKANTNSDNFKLNVLLKGFRGEVEFDQWIQKYTNEGWIYLKDLRLSSGVPTQVDAMLITSSGIYIYDVKNYDSKCTYYENKLVINGKNANHDIFIQAKTSKERLKRIFKEIGYEGPINFQLIFINEHCQMSTDPGFKNKFLLRNQLREHFYELNSLPRKIKDLELLKTKILQYEIDNPYDRKVIRPEQKEKIQKGIYCKYCLSFDTTLRRYVVHCNNCRKKERKLDTVKRLASEIGILDYDKNVSVAAVCELSKKRFTKNYLAKYLSQFLILKQTGRFANYNNPHELYDWEILLNHIS